MRGKIRKGIAFVLSAVIGVATCITTIPQMSVPVYAAGTDKKLQLGASALADNAGASGAATVYYGKNDQTWIVIGYETTGVASTNEKLALLAGSVMSDSKFYNSYNDGDNYEGSLLKEAVDVIYSPTYFTEKEMEAIIKRELDVEDYNSTAPYTDGISGTALTGNNAPYLWPLSTKEAYTLNNNGSGITNIGNYWWLRSPGQFNINNTGYAAIVDPGGWVNYSGNQVNAPNLVNDGGGGVRPAFNINLQSIILTSAAEGGKVAGDTIGTLKEVGSYTGNEWKLTISDETHKDFEASADTGATVSQLEGYTSWTVPITYSGATTGENEYVSVILTDSSGVALYYGHIANSSMSGTANVTIPTGLTEGTYTLKVFSEQCNDDKKTDLSSQTRDISLTVTEAQQVEGTYTVTFKNGDKAVATQHIEDGNTATEPSSPTLSGNIFIGWEYNGSIWNFNTPIHSDMTLTAKFKAENISVNENTGSGKDSTPVVENEGIISGKTAYTIYLVKGQAYTAGGKDWKTDASKIATVVKKTGKITGKKQGTTTVQNADTTYTVNVAAPAISANSKKLTLLVGQTGTVYLNLNAPNGVSENNYSLTWASSNPRVAEVTGGMVTAIAKGSAKITAYVGGKAYTSKVTVTDTCKAPAKITGKTAEFSMNPLQSFNLKFDSKTFKVNGAIWSGDGDNAMTETTNKNGKKTGYRNSIVEITTSGKITAIGAGKTVISGNDTKGNTVTLTVTVVPISSKEVTYITKGKSETIKFPEVTNSKADKWLTSSENVAQLIKTKAGKDTGKVKGLSYGKSDISCSYNGFNFKVTAYVEEPVIVFDSKDYTDNKGKADMSVGEMKLFKINKVYQTLNYSSNKPKVAFVDENGYVYARSKGIAVISTKVNGKTYKITITVKEP